MSPVVHLIINPLQILLPLLQIRDVARGEKENLKKSMSRWIDQRLRWVIVGLSKNWLTLTNKQRQIPKWYSAFSRSVSSFFQEIEMKCQEIVDTAMMYEEDTWSLEKSQENPLGVVFWRRTWKGCVLWWSGGMRRAFVDPSVTEMMKFKWRKVKKIFPRSTKVKSTNYETNLKFDHTS